MGTQLAFALYGAANRMVRLHKPLLEPLGLTFPQYLVVLELLNAAPLSVGDIGARLGMDTGTITPLLKRLEGAGVIVRARDGADERRVMVDLTSRGRALEAAVRSVPGKIQSACGLSDEEMDALRKTIEALAHASAE